MRKTLLILLILCLAAGVPLLAQEKKTEQKTGETAVQTPPPPPPGTFSYEAENRRDPFKDLLGGRDVKEKNPAGGITQIPLEDLVLVGIIKTKKGYTAIVGSSQGLPYFVNVGDKLADGYVLSITEAQVVFRKTHERGVPLMRPRDVIKEINPEER